VPGYQTGKCIHGISGIRYDLTELHFVLRVRKRWQWNIRST